MRFIAVVFGLALGFCPLSRADIIFTLVQATPGPITVGNSMDFNLFMRAAGGVVDNSGGILSANGIAGIDFRVNAADPLELGTATLGGVFTSGTSDYFPAANVPLPYQIPFPSSLAYFAGNNGTGLALGTTDQLVATLKLGTTGATTGTYSMGLNVVTVVDAGFAPFTISTSNSTSSIKYTITAVPEPSSLCLIGLVFSGLVATNRFLRKKSKSRATPC